MANEGLAGIVKPGLRAISLSVGGASAVSSLIQPNDRVDVLGSFSLPSKDSPDELEAVTLTVLQDVSVLATGQEMANARSSRSRQLRSSSYNAVTLEVTPREAELLVFAQQMKGRITLALRNSGDVSFEKDLPTVNFEKMESELQELNTYRQRNIRHKRD
jgi:pilus assembly protein CpaB